LCGDATEPEDVRRLQGDSPKARMAFSSPPYWVGMEYETQESVDEVDAFISLSCESFSNIVSKDYSRIVINTGTGMATTFKKRKKRQILLLVDKWANSFYELKWNLRHIRHWIKEGGVKGVGVIGGKLGLGPSTDIIDQHNEYIETFEHDDGKPIDFKDVIDEEDVSLLQTYYNTDGLYSGQNRIDFTLMLKSYWDDIKGTAKREGHVASFPVELVFRHLMLYSNRGDTIVDLFAGAGTVLVACQKMARVAWLLEIEPKYCDITVERFRLWCEENGIKMTFKKNGKVYKWEK
jgi:DNA modification methylase